jgi:hypothetical protein
VAPLLTLITYLVAAALAIGYVCETGLPSWRRATACVLSMVLAAGAGQLLTSANPVIAYAAGIPSLLALGAIMIAPERKPRPPASPNRRASDRARPATAATPWRFDRRAPRRRPSMPVRTDPRGARYTGSVAEITAEITYVARAAQIMRAPAVTRVPGGSAAGVQRAADSDLAARRQHGRRGAPRSLNRMSRCRYR